LKDIVTSADVDTWAKDGQKEVHLEKDVVLTSYAEELARKLNIKVYQNNTTSAGGKDSPRGGFSNPLMDERNIENWRKEFPILKTVIHCGNCSQAPQSIRVRDSITNYLENWLTVGMDWDYWCEEIVKAKIEFAKLINADVSEIACTSSVSEAVAGLLGSLNYSTPRNKIVTTEAEFPTIGQIALAHQKMGAKVDFVPVKNNVIDINDYDRYIDETTLVTVATQVYYYNGFKQDIAAIAKKAHDKGSYYFVDCYQGLGTIPVDVKAMDIDFLTSGTLKYLLGIPGIAFLLKRSLRPN
jgi:selenocysteine lyase/cysteine desulfurase